MEKIKLSLERILDVNEGLNIVENYTDLPQKDTYWLGRLADSCASKIKAYNKLVNTLREEIGARQKPALDLYNKIEDKNSVDAKELLDKINLLNKEFSDKHNSILDIEEEVNHIQFALSAFIAKEDITRVETKNEVKVETTIKKGQSLVPMKFYKLLGDFIIESE